MMRLKWLAAVVLLAGCASSRPAPEAPSAAPAPRAQRFELVDPPLIGTTPAGQRVYLGGFSGLRFLGRQDGKLRFLTHTDRGPNAEATEDGGRVRRPFLLPKFEPQLVTLEADLATGTLRVVDELILRRPDGSPLTGLPAATQVGTEEAVDSVGAALAPDPYGMDLESIERVGEGYWLGDEYGPTLARFDAEGRLQQMLKPGRGVPTILGQRRYNRGFEALVVDGKKLYAALQGPLDNPRSEGQENAKKSRVVRLVEIDLASGRTTAQYAIYLEHKKLNRIGDMTLEAPGTMLLILQDGKAGAKSRKVVMRLRLAGATNLQLLPDRVAGPGGALEGLDQEGLAKAGVVTARLEPVVDLTAAGVIEEKAEGLDMVEGRWLAVAMDNDFGLDGSWDPTTGKVGFKEERSALYLVPREMWSPKLAP